MVVGDHGAQRFHRLGLLLPIGIVLPVSLIYLVVMPAGWELLGGIAGVSGALLVVMSMIFMLRFPGLARWTGGMESMYQLHREFALLGYLLLLIHPFAITAGEWRGLNLEDKSWGFYAGWVSLALFVATLHLTFVFRARGIGFWRNLHWLTGLGFVLLVWHVVSFQIKNWTWLPAVLLDLLLLLGLVLPLARYFLVDRGVKSARYRVVEVNRPVPNVIDLRLAPVDAPLAIQPGQFVFTRFMTGESFSGCNHFHPFTVSSVYDGGLLRLSIKALGHCTRRMQGLQPGADARLQGPYGHLFENTRRGSHVWIAGGIGITPFLARAQMIDSSGVGVKLFYLNSNDETAAFVSELKEIERQKPNFEFLPISTHGKVQIALSVFDAMLPPWDDKEYVLCGPPGLLSTVRDYLQRNGVADEQIHEERFDFK